MADKKIIIENEDTIDVDFNACEGAEFVKYEQDPIALEKIGELNNLTTENKTNLVNAINETRNATRTNRSDIDNNKDSIKNLKLTYGLLTNKTGVIKKDVENIELFIQEIDNLMDHLNATLTKTEQENLQNKELIQNKATGVIFKDAIEDKTLTEEQINNIKNSFKIFIVINDSSDPTGAKVYPAYYIEKGPATHYLTYPSNTTYPLIDLTQTIPSGIKRILIWLIKPTK